MIMDVSEANASWPGTRRTRAQPGSGGLWTHAFGSSALGAQEIPRGPQSPYTPGLDRQSLGNCRLNEESQGRLGGGGGTQEWQYFGKVQCSLVFSLSWCLVSTLGIRSSRDDSDPSTAPGQITAPRSKKQALISHLASRSVGTMDVAMWGLALLGAA